jgi:hypothetical protein
MHGMWLKLVGDITIQTKMASESLAIEGTIE